MNVGLYLSVLLFGIATFEIALAKNPDWEVYAFYPGGDNWQSYDWDKITTFCIFDEADLPNAELRQTARSHGVKVVSKGYVDASCVQEADCRASWISRQLGLQTTYQLDGVNIDIEWAAPKHSPEQGNLTLFMAELKAALNPSAQLTFDAPWSPFGIDGRWYNFTAILDYIDFYFMMSYDEQSQMGDPPCLADANTPVDKTLQGLQGFLDMGIPPSKMVLGLPWYSYDYTCVSVDNGICTIEQVPFRGSPCSDAAGVQVALKDLLTTHDDLLTNSHLDTDTYSMYYWYEDEQQQKHQVWYDNPLTLGAKYQIAQQMDFRGVGFWNIDCLYYGPNQEFQQVTQSMWEVIPARDKIVEKKVKY